MRLLESLAALALFNVACGSNQVTPDGGVDAGVADAADAGADTAAEPDSTPPGPNGYHIIDGGSDGARACSYLGVFLVQSCCQAKECRGDCVQYDDAAIGCNCFGIVDGCPPKQECCAKERGCVAESVCLGTN